MCRRTILGYANHLLPPHYSVVIRNFHVFRAIVRPRKTNSELVVNPYAMLTLPIILKGFQQVARRNFQRFQGNDAVELIELSLCHSPDLLRTGLTRPSGVFPVKNIFCALVTERFYHQASSRFNIATLSVHVRIITDNVIYGNRYFIILLSNPPHELRGAKFSAPLDILLGKNSVSFRIMDVQCELRWFTNRYYHTKERRSFYEDYTKC